MILEKLVLENFRQFRGRQEILFSTIKDRNVTLVHAENGFGKTAMLNALLWGFYGHEGLTEDLPKKENIIHEGTAARSRHATSTSAKVTIWFSHDHERYRLERELTLEQQKLDAKKTDLTLELSMDGMVQPVQFAQKKILTLMPTGISEFLFFNGEGIEHLAREENSAKITEAIRQMLGLKLLETAIEDLRCHSVLGKLRTELKERASLEKAAKIDEQSLVDEDIADLNKRKETNQKNIVATDAELGMVNAKLELNREAHHLQTRREDLEKQQTALNDRLGLVTKRLGQIIAEDSYALFADDLVKRGREIVNKLRSEGKIPARVLNTFLKELLDSKTCICKRHLVDGSSERKAVEDLMTYAGDQQFNNAVGALDNALGRIEEGAEHTRKTLQETNAERIKIIDDLKVVREELADIHQKIGGKADEEVHKLEETREALLLKQRELVAEKARIELKLEEKTKRRDELTKEIQDITDSEADAQKAQRRLTAVEDSARLLERILEIETAELRPVLNKEIGEHFRKIIGVGYWAELSDDFKLKIMKRLEVSEDESDASKSFDLEVALSQGQRQVTSLVFIASMVALARRRSEIPTIVKGLTGSEYPMVMDSPFGQLSQFRPGVARWIPELAPQVIIFVSSAQFEGSVANELKRSRRIGKRYFLTYHGPHIHAEAKRELQIGKDPVTVYFENKEEFTEIQELES
ncbi:MAG TPA: AAA family ATPase [Candidatus Paceibacterota bacterium]|nr:AAA family ATPase [Candidatus Paceibacterota bacterium]